MNLKYSGLLFVLVVIVEAINGLALDKSSGADLLSARSATEKPHSENGLTTESLKIIILNSSEVINVKNSSSKSSLIDPQSITMPTTIPTAPTPSPTPSPAPITTPSPAPAPEKGHWIVRTPDNKTVCIIAEMAMQLNITYPGPDQKSNMSAIVNVPKNATAEGNCSKTSQFIIIRWGPGHSLQINFSTNKSLNNFFINELSLNVNATVFKFDNKTWPFFNSSSEFMTPLDMSYKCSKPLDITLKSKDQKSNLKAVLTLTDTQFEAYMNKTKEGFGAAQDCDAFDTPDIVPIAVGCALAILVIVVLIAYLIGRKRSLNRGYLSM